MIIMLAFGTLTPTSTMVVETKIWILLLAKSSIIWSFRQLSSYRARDRLGNPGKVLEFLAWRLTGVAPVEVREASATTEAALLGADFARDERLEAEEREKMILHFRQSVDKSNKSADLWLVIRAFSDITRRAARFHSRYG